MHILADSGLLTPGVQYGALGILALVLAAVFKIFMSILANRDALIADLIKTATDKDERNTKVLSDAAVMVSKTIEAGTKFLEASAIMEARERERGRSAGH
jgi:hypothetical protein